MKHVLTHRQFITAAHRSTVRGDVVSDGTGGASSGFRNTYFML